MYTRWSKPVVNSPCHLKQSEESIITIKGYPWKTHLRIWHLPGVVSSGMSKEYTGLENLGVWSFTSLMVIFILMSEDWRPSSARTSNEYLDLCSLSNLLVAIRSPDSGSIHQPLLPECWDLSPLLLHLAALKGQLCWMKLSVLEVFALGLGVLQVRPGSSGPQCLSWEACCCSDRLAFTCKFEFLTSQFPYLFFTYSKTWRGSSWLSLFTNRPGYKCLQNLNAHSFLLFGKFSTLI